MLKEKKKARIYLILIGVIAVLILAVIIGHALRGKASPEPDAVAPRATPQLVVKDRLVEKLVEVKKEVTAEEIRSGLNDMGLLITQEYYFTDVLRYSSIKELFSIKLGITESSFLASYDGVVSAGIDFARIEIAKDPESGVITVTLPKAEILSVDIDPESFQLYSEKTGLGNPISVEDFNSSLVELEQSARQKAIERGLLTKADENAKTLIRNFIAGLVGSAPVSFQQAA